MIVKVGDKVSLSTKLVNSVYEYLTTRKYSEVYVLLRSMDQEIMSNKVDKEPPGETKIEDKE